MKRNNVTRREFIALAGGATAAAVALNSCNTEDVSKGVTGGQTFTLDLSQPENLALTNAGGGKYLKANGDSDAIIVTRVSDTEVAAFSSTCTHQGCTVGLPVNNVLTCPCHGSQYSIRGNVIRSPATRNLQKFMVTLANSIVEIKT